MRIDKLIRARLLCILIFLAACDSQRFVAPPLVRVPITPIMPDPNLPGPIVMQVPAGATLPVKILSSMPATASQGEFFGIPAGAAATTASGTASLIWFATDGSATIWKMSGPNWTGEGATVLSIPSPWRLAATGDLNGDGNPDFIWEATTDGTRAVTFMNGPAYAGSYAMMFVFSTDWKIIGTGDFNSDNKADLVVTNTVTGLSGVLFLNGTTWTGTFAYLPGYSGYRPGRVADMNGDSKPDLVFFHTTEQWYLTSQLDGTNVLAGTVSFNWTLEGLGAGWRIGAAADFNFDGRADLVLENTTDGQRSILFMGIDHRFGDVVPTSEYGILPTVSTANSVVSTALIKYTTAPLNLKLNNFYVTQGVQDLARSVPLVAGRIAFVRAFVSANDYNTAAPVVRVRFTQTGGSFSEYLVTRPGDPGAPTFFSESSLGSTYNVTVTGALIAAGTTISVTVDPANVIAETDETDNTITAPLVVRTTPRFDARFVPVHLSGGATGNVSVSNVPNYMNRTMKVWPFLSYDADVHSVFNSGQNTLTTNEAWDAILGEILNLRTVEGNPRYYYGVLPNVDPLWGGMAYLGTPAAIGLEISGPADSATSEINAHEWGHNFNRQHSPGCGAGGPDPSYPVATGNTDSYGYDASAAKVKSPSNYYDIMSYCNPKWVSGWNVKQVLNFIAPFSSPAQGVTTPAPSLVVWGRISADGTAILEPSFEVTTIPRMPEGRGEFALEGLDASGGVLFSYAFEGLEIPDSPSGERHFSFAIPLSGFNAVRLRKLQVVRRGSHAAMGSEATQYSIEPAATAEPGQLLQRIPGGVDLRWNAKAYRMVMVRDAITGEVISFARGGLARILTRRTGDLELTFSDGVHSKLRRVAPL